MITNNFTSCVITRYAECGSLPKKKPNRARGEGNVDHALNPMLENNMADKHDLQYVCLLNLALDTL